MIRCADAVITDEKPGAPIAHNPAPFDKPALPGVDRTFAHAAMEGHNAEMFMAHLAVERSSAPEVKAFAQKMITENMGLADAMMPALLRVAGSISPQRLAAPDMLALEHLRTISNVDFDQVYATQQIGAHLATLTAFQTEADNGTDPQLKMLARKWLPTIQAHLKLAISLTNHIGRSSPFKSH
jgi:putative membrane protein